MLYWGIGNPSPSRNGDVRLGDNLYTDSVVALDPDSGELRWYFQFTPHDQWDWDAAQVPVLADVEIDGRPRKVMFWANRNGFYYVLDRVTGEFLFGKAFVDQTWAEGLNENGRPLVNRASYPTAEGSLVRPGVQGGTNWYAPSYNPNTGSYYVSVWEYASIYYKRKANYTEGHLFIGGFSKEAPGADRYGAVRSLDARTGERKWEFKMSNVTQSGLLSTAGGIVFGGNRDHQFFALDAYTGKLLWQLNLGGRVIASPITYLVKSKQHVSVAAGHSLYTFVLPE